MHPIFAITKLDIQSLDDVQARELVARLCRATVAKLGIEKTLVTWSGNQRAADGGVDVRVNSTDSRLCDTAIKKSQCAFQVKAEIFEPGKIEPEMAPKGIIRAAIVELANSNGAYIIASTKDDVSDSGWKKRIAAMAASLAKHGLAGKVTVDFYDSRRIADWAEQHPSVVMWVRHALAKTQTGWKPYGPWAYSETNIDATYLIDEQVKLFAPNSDQGSATQDAIDKMRSAVMTAPAVRLVGLSGVGKTRLVQALFDHRITTSEPPLNADNVIYADVSDPLEPQVETMVSVLCSEPNDCVVVIDNCSHATHAKLVEILSKQVGNVKLITIEYDIRDDLPVGTAFFRLEGSSEETISALLTTRYPLLSRNDVKTLVRVSDGNARLAFVLADTVNVTGELATLLDEALFDRLFTQNKMESDELLRCGQVASLVYSFDFDDDGAMSELKVLADLAGVTVSTFRRNIVTLKSRGVIQSRGNWRALLPHALSNRLAARALIELIRSDLSKAFGDGSLPRLVKSFSRRLGYLHESPEAATIVGDWLAPAGRLGNLQSLTILESQVFELIAPVSPEGALAAIERFSSDLNSPIQGKITLDRFASIVRLIAHDASLFDRCVTVLLKFSEIKDLDGSGRPSVDELLRSLFFASLSGTHATAAQRSDVVRRLAFSPSAHEVHIGLSLLEASLTTHYFTTFLMFEFGLKRRDYGWRPKDQDETTSWYSPFITIAGELGLEESTRGHRAREILGKHLRGLWINAHMGQEILAIVPALQTVDGWAEGWIAAKRILQHDMVSMEAQAQQQVIELEKQLTPKSLKELVIAKVLIPSNGDDDEAITLGEAIAESEGILLQLLPRIMAQHTSGLVVNFGVGVGRCIDSLPRLLPSIRDVLAGNHAGNSARFLRGVLTGWSENDDNAVSRFLDNAISDPVWANVFPELELYAKLSSKSVDRLVKSLELSVVPIWTYQIFGTGRATEALEVDQVAKLIDAIAAVPGGGQEVAINVLHMVVFSVTDHNEKYRKALGKYCLKFIRTVNWDIANEDSHANGDQSESIIQLAIDTSDSWKHVAVAFKRIVKYRKNKPSYFRSPRGNLIKPFLERYPDEVLELVCNKDKHGSYATALRILSDDRRFDDSTILDMVQDDTLIKWCAVSPDERFDFAIQACPIFSNIAPIGLAAPEKPSLSTTVHSILDNAPSKVRMITLLAERLQNETSSAAAGRAHQSLFEFIDAKGDSAVIAALAKAGNEFEKSIEFWESFHGRGQRDRAESFE